MVVFLALPAALVGCGDNSGTPDAAPPVSPRLVVLDPPGESIGLTFGGRASLAVRYENADGSALVGRRVEFAFVTGPNEDSGGSSLTAVTDVTDLAGIASVDLVAGAERVNFRVTASAPAALPAAFYVAVSEAGFTDLVARAVYAGDRPAGELSPIELRLYGVNHYLCADLDVEDPPESALPPRTMEDFGIPVRFANLASREPYTLLVWGGHGAGAPPLAAGCVELGAPQLRAGQTVLFDALVLDRPLRGPAGPVELSSALDLAKLGAVLAATGTDRPWTKLACPAGPGQLLLDCVLDAATGTDPIDCAADPAPHSELVMLVGARRGALDEAGCRPARDGLDRPSPDQLVTEAVAAGGIWPTGAALAELLAARTSVTQNLGLTSELELGDGGRARHVVRRARVILADQQYVLDLGATARPIVAQREVPASIAGGTLVLGEHGFTLRLGSLAHLAFREVALAAAGLGERADTLGSALVDSVSDAAGGDAGCAALSRLVCVDADLDPGCLASPCAAVGAALDARLAAWWRHLDGPGLDLVLSGTAPLYDVDDDLRVDAIGRDASGERRGQWSARLVFADGSGLAVTGTFGSATGQ